MRLKSWLKNKQMTYCRSGRCTCRPLWRNQGSWGLCTCHFLCNLGSTEGIHLNSFLLLTKRPEVNTISTVYNLLCRLSILIRNRGKRMFKSWAASRAASANCRPAFLLWFVIIHCPEKGTRPLKEWLCLYTKSYNPGQNYLRKCFQ